MPAFLIRPSLVVGLLALLIGFVCLLPFPLPRFADARYQFMKRNGLLGADRKALPDEEVERILALREGYERA